MQKTYKNPAPTARRDIHQEVTDTIIKQLEAGTVPWHKPWVGDDNSPMLAIPKNFLSGNKYRGVNIVLLWCSAISQDFKSNEWASFKQWSEKKECIRKGEKGSMIVYYDTMEKEVDGETKKIPFLKQSVVFNRCQLASYEPNQNEPKPNKQSLVERIETVETFVANTKAIVEHKDNEGAYYTPVYDKIVMPHPEAFIDTPNCTATEGYYSTLCHELTHWSGAETRLNRINHKKFGDENYATEELVAELGAAFLCAEFKIAAADKVNHAAYIEHWLKVLKDNKQCILTAASEASKAVDFLRLTV